MATGVVSWSKTAASNGTADANINFAEGMAASQLDDSCRAVMASVAKYRDDINGSLVTGGTNTAYTLTSNQVFTSLAAMDGQTIVVNFNATNGAAPTLNVDGFGAKALNSDTSTAILTGIIRANTVWALTYNNSSGVWLIQNFRPLQVKMQTFVANGTYTPTTNMLYCRAIAVGAGGGGGGAVGNQTGIASGGGGGGGGYAESVLTAAQIGASKAVTVSAAGGAGGAAGNNAGSSGGTSSVGTLVVATGGGGGGGAAAVSSGTGGAAGSGTTGFLTFNGNAGQAGGSASDAATSVFSGSGGSAIWPNGFNPGTVSPASGSSSIGQGGNTSGGGTGGITRGVGSTDIGGGQGGSGIVVIYEYCF
jgi:hypothetical protein